MVEIGRPLFIKPHSIRAAGAIIRSSGAAGRAFLQNQEQSAMRAYRQCVLMSMAVGVAALLPATSSGIEPAGVQERLSFSGGTHSKAIELEPGQTVAISAGIESPSRLSANGRLAVEWNGPAADLSWRKVLHALDPDVYLVYRAPQAGQYTLSLRAIEDEEPPATAPRWRENGILAKTRSFPERTPWPGGHEVPCRISIRPAEYGAVREGVIVEAEPNNSIAQAQALPLAASDDEQTLSVTGSADDIEYFDNGLYGESGDDWFRIDYRGGQPRLLSVNLMPTDHFVAARVRVYTPDGQEYGEGKHLNETTHEQ